MSDQKDKDPKQPTVATGSEKRSGRVSQDARGNSIWEWQLETGVYSRDISTQKLKKLDLDDLSIAETAVNKRPPGLEEEQKPKLPGGGFNPYDNSKSAGGGSNPYDNARATSRNLEPGKTAPPPPPRKPPDLQKLEEWMKIKKRVQDAKDAKDEDDDK